MPRPGSSTGSSSCVVGIPALVVTIGTQFLYRGLTLVLVNGKSYTLLETTGSIAGRLLVGRWFGVPMQFVWFVVLAVVVWVLLFRHRLGQNAHVIGDNQQAAGLMGIPIMRTRMILFVLTGVMAALAGCDEQLRDRQLLPQPGRRLPAARHWPRSSSAARRCSAGAAPCGGRSSARC